MQVKFGKEVAAQLHNFINEDSMQSINIGFASKRPIQDWDMTSVAAFRDAEFTAIQVNEKDAWLRNVVDNYKGAMDAAQAKITGTAATT